jgi:hypothetical protein
VGEDHTCGGFPAEGRQSRIGLSTKPETRGTRMNRSKLDSHAPGAWRTLRGSGLAVLALASLAALPSTALANTTRRCPDLSQSARTITVVGVGCRTADLVIERDGSGRSRPAGFVCRAINTASAHTISCRKGRSLIRYATGDALAITSAANTPAGLSVSATATADDPHDALILWATGSSCATDVPTAQGAANFGGPGGLLESEVGRGASGSFETPLATYEVMPVGPYSTTVTAARATIAPGEFSTVCALLFDPVGESPYPGQPRRIPQDYVFASTRAAIG